MAGPGDKQILVPLSLAELGESKLPVAVEQARGFGARVLLLHVIGRARGTSPEVHAVEAKARAYLEMIAASLRSYGLEAHLLIRYGPVAPTILEEIRTRQIDLVILGTAVRPAVTRSLIGSISAEVVMKAPCPVMLVKPYARRPGRPRPVRSFTEDLRRTGPVSPYDLGLRMVDPARIMGSVARSGQLEENFRLRKPSGLENQRYEAIREAMGRGESLPPVVLFKLGYGYYVVEGHRRVAAAKELGISEIAAEVRDYVPTADALRRQVFEERREFESATGLTRLAVALPGQYARLREMIQQFARQHDLADFRDAAQGWERSVYWPAARIIRASGWSQYFPDLRTADIFLLLSDSRERLSRQEGREVGWDEALLNLLPRKAPPPRDQPARQGIAEAIKSALGRRS